MKRLLAALLCCGTGLLSACGPAGEVPDAPGATGEIRLSLGAGAPVASIAIRNVFDPNQVYSYDCVAPESPELGAPACDQLVVLPAGVYQIVVTSADPDCQPQRDSYQVVVEPGRTVEVPVILSCGGGEPFDASDVNRPMIRAISFSSVPSGTAANQYICQSCTPGTGNERMEVQVTDADTACSDLTVNWSATNSMGADATATLLSMEQLVPGDPCRFSVQLNASAPVDDYTVSFSAFDGQKPASRITFQVHVQVCGCPCGQTLCGSTCVDTRTDPANCGGCGVTCNFDQTCVSGTCTSPNLSFSGVAQNLPEGSLYGWTKCYSDTYANTGTSLSTILAGCPGGKLMLACRPVGSTTLSLAAYAARADVTFDTGTTNTPHDANGVGWYYNDSWSWGFAPQGDVIYRVSCDTNFTTDANLRMCWHTGSTTLQTGYRCGNNTLNGNATWERVIYSAP